MDPIRTIREAKQQLKEILHQKGIQAAVGLRKSTLEVRLQDPIPEDIDLPQTVDGYPVNYEVVGPIIPREVPRKKNHD